MFRAHLPQGIAAAAVIAGSLVAGTGASGQELTTPSPGNGTLYVGSFAKGFSINRGFFARTAARQISRLIEGGVTTMTASTSGSSINCR